MTTSEAVAALMASVGGNPDAAIQAIIDAINHPENQKYDNNGFSTPNADGGVMLRGIEEFRAELQSKADAGDKLARYQLEQLPLYYDCVAGLAKLTPGTREYAIVSTAISWANLGAWGYIGGWIVHDVDKNPDASGAPWLRSSRIIPETWALAKNLVSHEQIVSYMRTSVLAQRPSDGDGSGLVPSARSAVG